jgi:hypothetical protein
VLAIKDDKATTNISKKRGTQRAMSQAAPSLREYAFNGVIRQ